MLKLLSFSAFTVFLYFSGCTQPAAVQQNEAVSKIIPAAERTEIYLPLLKEKRVAVFSNNTSLVGNTHLVDTLQKMHVDIRKIFAPEHGFRGNSDAGETVGNSKDAKTGIEVISLYGKKRKPTKEDVADVDVILFDIQDVGVRFFTYISSLEDLIAGAMETNKPLIVLDRPNPNGFYIDGPVLERPFRSFVGMQPVPVVYGMTIGEYAKMLVGEKWVDSAARSRAGKNFSLTIIPCSNYTHESKYVLPVKPSPNLPDMASVYLYPSTCFVEGTIMSEGRGTDVPFQVFGHPSLPDSLYHFTPRSREGAKNPKQADQDCRGWNLGGPIQKVLSEINGKLQLRWFIQAYKVFPGKDSFFLNNGKNFNRLAGNDELITQIKNGVSEASIRKSWQPALDKFKAIRQKYLLYKDFK